MNRLLIIPEAGRILTRVSGRPMLDHLERLHRRAAGHAVLVTPPSISAAVRSRLAAFGLNAAVVEQPENSSAVDAILLAAPAVLTSRADRVWITWCDRVAISPATVARLRELEERDPDADVIMPVNTGPGAGIERDDTGRLSAMEPGAEAGLFSLSRRAYLEDLRWFAPGATAFLPFLAGRRVVTFPVDLNADLAPTVAVVAIGPGLRDRIARSGADLILLQKPGIGFDPSDEGRMLAALEQQGADIVVAAGNILTLCPRSLLLNIDLDLDARIDREIQRTARRGGMRIARVPARSTPPPDPPARGLRGWLKRLRPRG